MSSQCSIRAVTVIADILRPCGDGSPGEVDRMTRWVADAIRPAVRLAASLPVESVTTDEIPKLRAWVAAQRPPSQADAWWARHHGSRPRSRLLDDMILDRLEHRFCVGYEMPPWLVAMLDEAGIPYVDIRLHPIRFLDDLIFAVRGADPEIQACLAPLALPLAAPHVAAGLLVAMGRYISQARIPPGTLLIAGQRRFDSTQIADGRFFDAEPRAETIHAICRDYKAVVLKPHPHDQQHTLLHVAAGVPSQILGILGDNAYRLLSLPEIEAVLTVNSGLGLEAPYFGKRVHTLLPYAISLAWQDAPDAGSHLGIGDTVLVPDFWRLVLGPHMPVSAPDGYRLPAKPNRLRIALDSFWNFHQVDTDRIPRTD